MSATIDVLDVGHGSCIVIREVAAVILIDTGGAGHVLEYLEREQIQDIDTILISHADEDHVRGLLGILSSRISVARILLNSDSTKNSLTWRAIVHELAELDRAGSSVEVRTIQRGESLSDACPSIVAKVLAPGLEISLTGPGHEDDSGRRFTSNTASAVVRIEVDGTPTMLATGDLDATGWEYLKSYGEDLSAHYLVLPHHGGRTASTKDRTQAMLAELTGQVGPSEVLVSNGRGRYGNPRQSVLSAVFSQAPGCRVSCSQVSKKCQPIELIRTVGFDNPEVYSAGAAKSKSCAGSIRLNRANGIGVPRRIDEHDRFVDLLEANAICREVRR